MEHELTEHGQLLDSHGELIERGWARSLVKTYDRKRIKASPLRIKEWDYYLITDHEFGLALTIDDNSYMGLGSVSLLDFSIPEEVTKSEMNAMPMGRTHLPADSGTGDVFWRNQKMDLAFTHENGKRHLIAHVLDFSDGLPLDTDLWLRDEPKDSLVILTPYAEDRKAFYYNQKICCLRAEGYIALGGRVHHFDPAAATGCLDWGRGVWLREGTWYWSNASGYVDGHSFGFNFGYGFGDTSAASENILFYDGIGHKLDRVTFRIPKNADGSDDFLSAWHFTENNGRVNLVFEPILDRHAETDVKLLYSLQHQVFGKFSGTCILDDGRKVVLKEFLGFAEKVKNRW